MGLGPDHCDDDQNATDRCADDTEIPAGRSLRDEPPGTADHQGHTDQPGDQKPEIADRKDHH